MIHSDTIVWFACGLLTVYLMYGRKEEIPVFKAVIVAFFGIFSLAIWCIANIGKKIPNPLVKRVEHHVVPPEPCCAPEKKKKS